MPETSANSCNPIIYNLSTYVLTENDIEVLKNGPKFTPTPLHFSNEDFRADMLSLSRKLKLSYAYRDNKTVDPSLIKLKGNQDGPKPRDRSLAQLCTQIDQMPAVRATCNNSKNPHKNPNNMCPPLYSALKNMSSNDNLILKAILIFLRT